MTIKGKVASTGTEQTDPTYGFQDPGKDPALSDDDDSYIKNATRRIVFNGSSYSGADIKVLVHKYQDGPLELLNELEKAIGTYTQIQSILNQLKINTDKVREIKDELSIDLIDREEYDRRFFLLWKAPTQTILQSENLLSQEYGLNQYLGRRVESFIIPVQIDETAVAQQINIVQAEIDDLLRGWLQQKAAIEQKKESGRFFQTKVLAELQTLSISTYREKRPVRSFGRSNPHGWVRSGRTHAGSMIFTVFDRSVLFELLDFDPSDFDADNRFKAASIDQLPPMDITIQFANEYGSLSRMTIYGIEFVSDGNTYSIEDLFLENVCQFVCRDVDPMTPVLTDDGRPYTEVLLAYNQALAQGRRPDVPLKASDLIGSDWGANGDEDASETRFRNRRNPFF